MNSRDSLEEMSEQQGSLSWYTGGGFGGVHGSGISSVRESPGPPMMSFISPIYIRLLKDQQQGLLKESTSGILMSFISPIRIDEQQPPPA